jgi:segregation and condensation protein A
MTDETHKPSGTPSKPSPAEDAKGEASSSEREAPAKPAPIREDDNASPFSVTVGQVYDGPLDLLLDLVRKQNIDIYDIPIAKITAQFLAYVEHLKVSDVDTAGEFIYMSALLIHIKSKMLLPRSPAESPEEAADPRLELVERLLEHERFRNAAQMLQQKRQLEEATWTNPGMREFRETADADQDIAADTLDLVRVFREVIDRAKSRPVLDVSEDSVTVRQMIDFVRRRLMMEDRPVGLSKLLANTRSVNAVVAMFLALLELVRLQAILLRQDRGFSEIYIKKHEQFEHVINERLSARDDWS